MEPDSLAAAEWAVRNFLATNPHRSIDIALSGFIGAAIVIAFWCMWSTLSRIPCALVLRYREWEAGRRRAGEVERARGEGM